MTASQTNYQHRGLIDQIPFNVVLSDNNKSKKIYNVSNLSELYTDKERKVDSNDKGFQNHNILCLGGVNFNSEQSSLTRNLWNYLPGTLDEINFIKNIFQNNYQVSLLSGNSASKSRFIDKINTSSFKIIHLATHSFYAEFDPSKNPFTKIPISILPQRELRSAILFTKGGDFENYESLERLKDFLDKNLTLAEIIYLPIRNTKLLVLASCETNIGLPKVYEDIYGNISLNTAFKYAGAQYVLGTRWEVSDQYSKQFYSQFYNHLEETDNIEFSFEKAIQELKLLNSDPFIWGTFILVK